MARRKWSWTNLQHERANMVIEIAKDLKEYWPLTLRQIYYQMVFRGYIKNNRSRYNMLSKLVKWMRIDEMLEWDAVTDRARRVSDKRGYPDMYEYIESELQYFLNGYARCRIQGQDNYIEVWFEKDALSTIFERVAWPYCVRTVVCRGYQSVTFIAEFYKRATLAMDKGQQPVVLYFGDLDPSGVQMLEATQETLESELMLDGVVFKRIGLNPEHISRYNLPHDPNALKRSDSRSRQYLQKYGPIAVELDALHPSDLTQMTRQAIESHIDMDFFNEQKEVEQVERGKVNTLCRRVERFIREQMANG